MTAAPGMVGVVSNGFKPLIAPLLRDGPQADAQILAAPLWGGLNWRFQGKRALAEAHFGKDEVGQAVFVTDHESDVDLLEVTRAGFLVKWPEARFEPAFADSYIPLHYAARVKRNPETGRSFLTDNLGDDLLVVLLAFCPFSTAPIATGVAITLMHFSFWTIYELGYHENDVVSSTLEHEKKVPPAFEQLGNRMSPRAAWVWAVVLGAFGAAVAGFWAGAGTTFELSPTGATVAIWMAFLAILIVMRKLFFTYNHIDKISRTYLYLPLQFLKYSFPAVFAALPPAGAALILAQIMRRWIPYLLYRFANRRSHDFPARLMRLAVLATTLLLLVPSSFDAEFAIHGGVALVWFGVRSVGQAKDAIQRSSGVDKDSWAIERTEPR